MQQNNHRPPDVNRREPINDGPRRTSLIERINGRVSKIVTYRTNSQFSYSRPDNSKVKMKDVAPYIIAILLVLLSSFAISKASRIEPELNDYNGTCQVKNKEEWNRLNNIENIVCGQIEAYEKNKPILTNLYENADSKFNRLSGCIKHPTNGNNTKTHDWSQLDVSSCGITADELYKINEEFFGFKDIEPIENFTGKFPAEVFDRNSSEILTKLCFPKLAWDFFSFHKQCTKLWPFQIIFMDETNGFNNAFGGNVSRKQNHDVMQGLYSSSDNFYTKFNAFDDLLKGGSCKDFEQVKEHMGTNFLIKGMINHLKSVITPILPYGYKAKFACPPVYLPPENSTYNVYCVDGTGVNPLNMDYTYDFDLTSAEIDNNCDVCKHQKNMEMKSEMTTAVTVFGKIWIGLYCISIPALVIAIFLMVYLRKIRSQTRNLIHINMLISFLLKAVGTIWMINSTESFEAMNKNTLTTNAVEYCSSLVESKNIGLRHICRFAQVLYKYGFLSNILWLLIEGVHLFSLLANAFSEKSPLPLYLAFGWGLPIPIVTVWVLVRYYTGDPTCWNTQHHYIRWIIDGPFTVSFVLCTCIFFYILIVVYKKTRAVGADDTHKKLVNSFVSLFPLLGIHYCVSRVLPADDGHSFWWKYTRMVIENSFDSVQGLAVSIIYCFMNGEIQHEVRMLVSGYKQKRQLSANAHRRRSTHAAMQNPGNIVEGSPQAMPLMQQN